MNGWLVDSGGCYEVAKDVRVLKRVGYFSVPHFPGSVSALKLGEYDDIVGVCNGPLPNSSQYATAGVYGWLLFTGCIFVPSGTVDLPASGGPGVVLPY